MGIVEGREGGDGHLSWVVLLVGLGLNSLGDLDKDASWWELVLQEAVRLVVGLSGGGCGWSWGSQG